MKQAREIEERLLRDRIVFLSTPIDDSIARHIIAQMLFLEAETHSPITMHINSPGGSISASMAVLDTMKGSQAPVHTVCVKRAAGTAALLLAGGVFGCRFARSAAHVQLFPMQAGSTTAPTERHLRRELTKAESLIIELLAQATAQPQARIRFAMNSRLCLPAPQAKAFGFVDTIITG